MRGLIYTQDAVCLIIVGIMRVRAVGAEGKCAVALEFNCYDILCSNDFLSVNCVI